jgi:hypothetical protein
MESEVMRSTGDLASYFQGVIVDPTPQGQLNQAAYRQLRDAIGRTYPPGRFIAISGGKIVADAGSFDELNTVLRKIGQDSTEVLVVQAGVEYPEEAIIFAQGKQSGFRRTRRATTASNGGVRSCNS